MTDRLNRRQSLKAPMPRCVLGGETKSVDGHHPGGQNHVPWFTMPLCRYRHERLHEAIRAAGVDLRYTPNKKVRLVRALMAITLLVWELLRELLEEIEREEKSK